MSGDPSLGSTTRFTDRVAAYVRSRPSYPPELFDLLKGELGLQHDHVVVDVGSGTGILAEQLLERGCTVIGIEPNDAMRAAAEGLLAQQPRFRSVDGTAEATGLRAAAADFVVAGQAFHWFDPEQAARELRRVLRPAGWAVVVWNVRRRTGSEFLVAFEQFHLDWGTDYSAVAERHAEPEALARFFRPGQFESRTFANVQSLDGDGLHARIASSSYMPGEGHPRNDAMNAALRRLFADHQESGLVRIEYDTPTFWGRL